jgi:hypothetical protein
MGRSRGGLMTKIHALTDARGLPLELVLTPGQAGDCPVAEHLLGWLRPDTIVLADKAYQAVAEVLLSRARRELDCKPVGGRGDKDDRHGLLGVEEEQISPRAGSRLFRGSGPDQQPHENAEIVAGDMDQIALVDILASAQPGPPHAASVERVGE